MPEKVVVVGAGPVGLACAKNLAEKGFEAIVLEEHPDIGVPVNCSGLVSKSGSFLEKIPMQNAIINEIEGAKIYSPEGEMLCVHKFETVAYVIDREKLDKIHRPGAPITELMDGVK